MPRARSKKPKRRAEAPPKGILVAFLVTPKKTPPWCPDNRSVIMNHQKDAYTGWSVGPKMRLGNMVDLGILSDAYEDQRQDLVKLTPEQRHRARENFQTTKSLPVQKKSEAWQSYQQLTEEQKKALAAAAKAQKHPTAVTALPGGAPVSVS